MIGSWVVSSVVNFSGNATAFMDRLGVSTRAAAIEQARLTGNVSAAEAAFLRHQQRIENVASAYSGLALKISGVVAIGGAAFLGAAVERASKLQQILLSIKNETGASNTQLGGIYNDVFNIGNRAGMSPIAAAEIWRTVGRLTAGQMSIAQMRAVAPLVADFASTVHFNRPDIDVNDAATVGMQTAHLFRAYTPKTLDPLLDKIYRLYGLMVETPEQALRQMSYYEPMFKGLGIDSSSSIAMMALLDRAGFRNKVGTNVRAMLLEALGPLQVTGFAQAGKLSLLEQMGIFNSQGRFAFNNKDGSTDFMGVLYQLSRWEHEQRAKGVPQSELAKELYGVFGRQGGTIATLMSDPTMVAFLQAIRKYLGDPNVSLAAGTNGKQRAMDFQFGRAVSNLDAVLTELGTPWLDGLTGFFKALADDAHSLQAFLHQHGDFEKAVALTAAAITGIAGVVALGGLARLGIYALAIPAQVTAISTSLGALSGSLGANAATISTESLVAAGGLSRFGAAILGFANIMANPLVVGAIATAAAFGYGLKVDKDFVESHPGATMFGTNYGSPGQEVIQAGGYAAAPRVPVPRSWSPEAHLLNLLKQPRVTISGGLNVNVYGSADPKAVRAAVTQGIEDARRAQGANHSTYQPNVKKPLPATVPPR